MLAADHAAQLRKPIVMVKVGKTDAGRSMAQSHTGHLTGSDAVTSAVFRQFGVTRVDGLDELLEVSSRARAHPAREAARLGARRRRRPACACTRSRAAPARTWPTCSPTRGCGSPTSRRRRRRALHDGLIPAYLRVSNPVDCGGPPVADARGRKILDVILADKNVDILVIPITGAVATFSEPFTRDMIEAAKSTTKPIFVIWGAPVGHRRHVLQAPARRRPADVPHVQQLRRRGEGYADYWTFAARYRSPFDDAPREPLPAAKKARKLLDGLAAGRGAVGVELEEAAARVRHQDRRKDVLCTSAAEAVQRREAASASRS